MSQAYQDVPEWLEQVAEEAVGSSYGPAGGKFASKDRREVSKGSKRNSFLIFNDKGMTSSAENHCHQFPFYRKRYLIDGICSKNLTAV